MPCEIQKSIMKANHALGFNEIAFFHILENKFLSSRTKISVLSKKNSSAIIDFTKVMLRKKNIKKILNLFIIDPY